MSRIGKKIIAIPKGVKVDVQPGAVEVQGPKGKLRQPLPAGIGFEVDGDQLQAQTLREDPELGKFHGLARSLVANAVRGVTEGFSKELDIVGVGYRAEVKGKQVRLRARLLAPGRVRHPDRHRRRDRQADAHHGDRHRPPAGRPGGREHPPLRKPDPYKQKGVRYTGEVLKKKAGKTGAK